MDLPTPDLLHAVIDNLPTFLLAHPQHPRKYRDPQRLKPALAQELRVGAELLLERVFGPCADGLLFELGAQVGKAGGGHYCREGGGGETLV